MSLSADALSAGYRLDGDGISGGSASVFRAIRESTGKPVAFKLLSPTANPARIEREAALLASIDHPGIVRYHDVGKVGHMPFLVTDWIDGEQLATHLSRNGPFLPTDALALFSQLASALQAAHDAGVAHGDISPANIMVSDETTLTIIDFGIARNDTSATVTAHDDLAGTPRYLAPEIIQGASRTFASDQYAAAIILSELLTGNWPFDSNYSVAAALHHQLHTEPVSLREINPSISIAVEQAVDKALSKSPQDRHDSMTMFCAALYQPSDTTSIRAHTRNTTSRSVGWSAVMSLFVAGCATWLYQTSSTGESLSVAAATQDTATACNLMPNPGFDSPIKEIFYPDEKMPDRVSIVDKAEMLNSPVLRVGKRHEYGLYGLFVPVVGGDAYHFSAEILQVGKIPEVHLRVEWLDANWQSIEDQESVQPMNDVPKGRAVLSNTVAPGNAKYAVPTVFKDGSDTELFVDDLIFAPVSGICP